MTVSPDHFRGVIPDPDILVDSASRQSYAADWTRPSDCPKAGIVLRPHNEGQVSEALKVCHRENYQVVPSGGRTGLAAGAVAHRGEVVISLEKMNRILGIHPHDRSIEVEAGVTTEQVQRAAEEAGFSYPIDLAAKGSCQIGGNIATNAGGIKFIRHGGTREQVIGLEVVLADGAILDLNCQVRKNNTGYDLKQLFIGSEGTLGIITKATLKLAALSTQRLVILLGVAGPVELLSVLASSWQMGLELGAFEFFSDRALRLVLKNTRLRSPFTHPCGYYALIELDGCTGQDPRVLEFLDSLVSRDIALEGTIAEGPNERATLWALRENITESLSAEKVFLYKNDIAVPVESLEGFFAKFGDLPRHESLEPVLFGHLGDGNIHVNLLGTDRRKATQEYQKHVEAFEAELYPLIKQFGGSISAEHGVGLLKKQHLHYVRSPAEIAWMKQIKAIFDVKGIMNPGKIFDL